MPAPPLSAAEREALAEAASLLERGNPRPAAERLAPLILGGCRDPDLLLTYSTACEQAGLTQEAAGALQAAIEHSPERAELWGSLGSLLVDLGRAADAVKVLERAVALDPAVPAYWYNLGIAALSAGMLERGEQALRQSLGIDDQNPSAWAALGLVQQQ